MGLLIEHPGTNLDHERLRRFWSLKHFHQVFRLNQSRRRYGTGLKRKGGNAKNQYETSKKNGETGGSAIHSWVSSALSSSWQEFRKDAWRPNNLHNKPTAEETIPSRRVFKVDW
jgi:hypothetical protein